MPKSIVVDPRETRKQGKLSLCDIPLNLYVQDLKKEAENRGKETLLLVYRDMVVIREFETMLNSIKTKGAYQGISYDHAGPAHLSIGQESAVVGQCLTLGVEDFIFGSHRSHGEIIAKCLSAIGKASRNDSSAASWKSYMGGAPLRVVRERALRFPARTWPWTILSTARLPRSSAGERVQQGNGRLHARLLRALWEHAQQRDRGRVRGHLRGRGAVQADQPQAGDRDLPISATAPRPAARSGKRSWLPPWTSTARCGPKRHRRRPAHPFQLLQQLLRHGRPDHGRDHGLQGLARIGAGVNPEQMHAERVDGYNPLAVADAIERKSQILQEGKGPVLLDVVTYRYSGHSPSDASSYRTKEEVALWQER